MLLECGHCGAPIDVETSSLFARCHYCGRTQRVRSGRTQLPHTPPQWQPPAQWVPPPHVPARSVPLTYDPNKSVLRVVLAIVAVSTVLPIVIAGGIMGAVFFQTSSPSSDDDRHRRSPPKAASPTRKTTEACRRAVACCKVVAGDGGGCDGMAKLPEASCKQTLDQMRESAKALGLRCD